MLQVGWQISNDEFCETVLCMSDEDSADAHKENGAIFVSKVIKRTVSRQSQLVEISYDWPWIGL
jgi:hypothetical protein